VAIPGGLGVVGVLVFLAIQRRARGDVDPDSFTYGTSEQRARWFDTGRESGEPAACDTFSPGSA
jgi:predicted metalloprotease